MLSYDFQNFLQKVSVLLTISYTILFLISVTFKYSEVILSDYCVSNSLNLFNLRKSEFCDLLSSQSYIKQAHKICSDQGHVSLTAATL